VNHAEDADPGASPRIPFGGTAQRERPVYRAESASGPCAPWEIEITPLEGTTGATKGKVLFELRVQYRGLSLPEFGPQGPALCIREYHGRDLELLQAMAVAAGDVLREGAPDGLLLNVLALRFRPNQGSEQ
jgi:hypothetical protein